MIVPLLLAAALAHPTTAANHAAARREAPALLARVVLPAGAVRVARGPLRSAWAKPGLRDLVDVHRTWSVTEPIADVRKFVRTHPAAGSRLTAWGTGGLEFDLAGTRRLYARSLMVGLRALAGGETAVRVDAQVAWRVLRSAAERVPAGVREVEVSKPSGTRRVTAARKVREIVRWFDALPVVQPTVGFISCPAMFPGRPAVTVQFRGARGAVLVSARSPGVETCGESIDIRVRGRREPALMTGAFLVRLQRVVEMRLLPRAPR
jgi:hypothetical protein